MCLLNRNTCWVGNGQTATDFSQKKKVVVDRLDIEDTTFSESYDIVLYVATVPLGERLATQISGCANVRAGAGLFQLFYIELTRDQLYKHLYREQERSIVGVLQRVRLLLW